LRRGRLRAGSSARHDCAKEQEFSSRFIA
jgi:hypothetical protein